jgi:hypothetical protein
VDYSVSQVKKILQFLGAIANKEAVIQTVRNFASTLYQRMNIDRRFANFPDKFLAAALLNPEESNRKMLTSSEIDKAKNVIASLAFELPEEVIDTGAASSSSVSTGARNPVDAVFEEMELQSSKRLRIAVSSTNDGEKTVDEELTEFLESVNVQKPGFVYFRDEGTKYPKLRRVAKVLFGLLPSPANAERCFSKASFYSENRKNRLTSRAIRVRLMACNLEK